MFVNRAAKARIFKDVCSFSSSSYKVLLNNVAQSQQSWNMSAIPTMFSTLLHKSGFLFRNISTNLRHKNRFVCCYILFERNVLSNHICCFVILLQCRLQTLIVSRASRFSQDHISLKCFLWYKLRIIQITWRWHFMSKLKRCSF